MFLLHVSRGACRNYKLFWSLGHEGCSSRHLHSLKRCQYKRPFQSVNSGGRRSVKPQQMKNVDTTTYMRDIVWKISSTLRNFPWDSAAEHLESLSIRWDSFTVNQVLKTHPPLERAWLFFNWVSKKKGIKHDQFTYTTMLDIFGEARRISSMKYVFQQMREKGITIDVVTYTSLLHWLSNDGDVDGAVKAWKEMRANACHPTAVSYTAYMKVLFNHNRAEEAIQVYKEMCDSGCSPTCYTYTILMEYLIDSGKYRSALEMFSKMQDAGVLPDKAACNILIEKCSKAGETWAITEILRYMKENFLVLRYPVYIQAREALSRGGDGNILLQQVNPHIPFEDMSNDAISEAGDFASNSHLDTDSGLLLHFLSRKNFASIDQIVTSMGDKNVKLDCELISTIIKSSCAHERESTALLMLDYILKVGIDVDQAAYRSVIGFLLRKGDFSKTMQIIEEMAKLGYFLENDFTSLLIYRLGNSNQIDLAAKVFDLLPEDLKNTATYTALISAYLSAKDARKGIETFEMMKNGGVCVALGTYNALISGLEKCGRGDAAKSYIKERKSIPARSTSLAKDATEQALCNLLFTGLLVS